MSFLDKIEKMVNIANTAVDIGTKIKGNDLLSGINLGNVDINNMGSIQSSIESAINNKVNELTNGITSSIDVGQIENMANSISLNDFDIPMPDIPGLEGISFM